jgi:galactofuranose transport system permease protein
MKLHISSSKVPLLATVGVFLLMFIIASLKYTGFASPGVFIGLFSDNAFLGVAAVGITFVILSGGIDLSVGAMVGFTSILLAVLIEHKHMAPALAVFIALAIGTVMGSGMGSLVRYFALPPFLVTLAGMFLARGMGFVISVESIPITHPLYTSISDWRLNIGTASIPATAMVLIVVVALGIFLSQYTRFGRNTYAIGGNAEAANLMGLPVGSTKIRIYAFSGFCSALAGVVFSLYSSSGSASAGVGLELDAIAAVVIGGTLLTGGVGHVAGTLIGVLIFGIIQAMIMFQGTLSSWWTKIAVGILVLVFVLLQKVLARPAANTT